MKEDKAFSSLQVCPKTGLTLSTRERNLSEGVCPKCGDKAFGSFTHRSLLVGKWTRPNLLDVLRGNKKFFTPNEEQNENHL